MSQAVSRGQRSGAFTRAAAARIVDRVIRGGKTLEAVLSREVPDDLSARDRAQISALSFGTLRWHCRHRLIINRLLDRPLRSKDAVIESLLSVGLFQLLNPRQPGYAAVSATVEATRQLGRPRATGLVNAALRRFQREQAQLVNEAMQSEEGEFAHPQWIIDRVRSDWPEQWRGILEASLAHPPLWLRVNRAHGTREAYAERLAADAGLVAHSRPGFADALRLEHAVAVSALPGFEAGDVSVQDAASQLAVELLAPQPGMRVLDACAAPGGKSMHMLERTGGRLDLLAIDIDAERNALLEDNLRRIGMVAEVVTGDVLSPDCPGVVGTFDRILLDAPCSASGVIRRHPDIRFLRRPDDMRSLADRQRRMLDRLWPLLKPGGRFLYSTCSVFRAENERVVEPFLSGRSDAEELRPLSGDVLHSAAPLAPVGYQLLPTDAGTDGFYYALMIRET